MASQISAPILYGFRLSLVGIMLLTVVGCTPFGSQQLEHLQQQVAQVTVPHKSILRVSSEGQTREFSLNEQIIGFDGKTTTGTTASRRACPEVLENISRVLEQALHAYGNAIATITVAIATPQGSPTCTVTRP